MEEKLQEFEKWLQSIKKDLEHINDIIKLNGKRAEEEFKYHKQWCEKRIKDIETMIDEEKSRLDGEERQNS